MKNNLHTLKVSLITIAVMACMASIAKADDEEIAALKNPTNTVDIGIINTSIDSNKFGEYTGLNKKGVYGNGGFDIRGGSAYGLKGEEGGTYRWYLKGNDVGLSSRSVGAGASDQGVWKLDFNYDELTHYTSTGYQTPFIGTMGGNSWSLPNHFALSSSLTGTVTPIGGLSGLPASSFSSMDVSNTRKNTTVSGSYIIDSALSLNFDYNHLLQSGAKLQGFGTQVVGTGASGVLNAIAIIPVPTNSTTDTISLGMNWKRESYRFSTSYFGSFFRNNYSQVSLDPFYAGSTNTAYSAQSLSLAPSNDFHQLNFNGGYDITNKTKLTGNFSFSRNTQSDSFTNTDVYVGTPPLTSMNGLINTTHAETKLINQSVNNLTLSGAAKYDERLNLSPANTYAFASLDGLSSSSHIANYSNTPLSTRKTKLLFSADYKIDKSQITGVNYEYENIHRWCNQYASAYAVTSATTSGVVTSGNPIAGSLNANCVILPTSQDNKVESFYKVKFDSDVDWKLAYSWSHRIVDYDTNAYAAFLSGLNAGNYTGFVPGFEASRVLQTIKSSNGWQVNDQLSLSASARGTYENYDANIYGLQSGRVWSLNLDATYAYGETGTVIGYVTQQHRDRFMTSANGTTSTSYWNNILSNDDLTIGIGIKQKDLLAGKLTITGDLTYSFATSNYTTIVPVSGTTVCASTAPASTNCSLPDIKTELLKLKLSGIYQLDKNSKVSLVYLFQHLDSNDYFYNAYLIGVNPYSLTNGASTVLPNGLTSGTYNVHLLGLSYLYNF
ncbi:MAG: MtrB/PioB family decaheme-associated outer membrane protein [Betaproteobacteria bacterium]